MLSSTSPVPAAWPPGAASSLPLRSPQKHHWQQEPKTKQALPSRISHQDTALAPPPTSTTVFMERLYCLRRKYVFPTEVQPLGPTGYGDSNQHRRRWSADPLRKADGAWLGLLNCSKTQIFRCFQLPYPEMAMKKECECPEPLRATQTHMNCPRLLREGRTGRPAWWPCGQAGKNHTTPH